MLNNRRSRSRSLQLERLETRDAPAGLLGLPGYSDELIPFNRPADITGIASVNGSVALVDSFGEDLNTPAGDILLSDLRNTFGVPGPTSGGPDGWTSIILHQGYLYAIAVSPASTDAIFKVSPDLSSVSLFAQLEIFDRGDFFNYSSIAFHDGSGHAFVARQSSLAELDAGGAFIRDLAPGDFNGDAVNHDTLYALRADGVLVSLDLADGNAMLNTLIDLPGSALYTDLKWGSFGGAAGLFVEAIENGQGHLSFFPASDLASGQALQKPICLFEVTGATGKFDLSTTGQMFIARDHDYLRVQETLRLEVVQDTVEVTEGKGPVPVIRVHSSAPPVYPMDVTVTRVSGDTDIQAVTSHLVIDSRDWRADHYVSLQALDDPDAVAGQAILRLSQANGTPVQVTVSEKDKDGPLGLELMKATVNVPEGRTNIEQLRLSAKPASPLTIHTGYANGDTDLSVAYHADLTIPPDEWDEWHYVVIGSAVDADAQNGSANFAVTAPGCAQVHFIANEAESVSNTVEYQITVDSFEALPLEGEKQPDSYYNNLNSHRGKIENDGVTTFERGSVESRVTSLGGFAGAFESVNRTLVDKHPLNFGALLNPAIKPEFQYRAVGLEFEIEAGAGTFKTELKDPDNHSLFTDLRELPGGPVTIFIPLANPPDNVQSITWLIEGSLDSFVRVRRVSIVAEGPDLQYRAAFLWAFNGMLQNFDTDSGLVGDQARFPTPDFAGTNSMGVLAALVPQALAFGMIDKPFGEFVESKISDAMLDLQANVSHEGVLPHFVRQRFIVDNESPDFQILTGNWTAATTPAGFYGANYLTATMDSGQQVRWNFEFSRAGNYKVYARWAAQSTNASNAAYTVYYRAGQSTTVHVNQRAQGDEWVLLGEFAFDAGIYSAVLSSDGANGNVVADAVRLDGPPHIIPGTEYSTIDTGIGVGGSLLGLQGLNMPTAPMEQALRQINWSATILPGNVVSHGFKTDGTLLLDGWAGFGGESLFVAWMYASATGNLPAIPNGNEVPQTDNGAGFIDLLMDMFAPPVRQDFNGVDWDTYQEMAAQRQFAHYDLEPVPLGGASAGEVPIAHEFPAPTPPAPDANDPCRDVSSGVAIPYFAYGLGGRYPGGDGSDEFGAPVAMPHYLGMVFDSRPAEAERAIDYLVNAGLLTPLNNVESLVVQQWSGQLETHVNTLKGSLNMGLIAQGLANGLLATNPLHAAVQNPFLKAGFNLIAPRPLQIITTTLATNWPANAPGYKQTIATLGGTGADTFAVAAGSLPAGLTLSVVTGVISGTPTTAGTSAFTVTATDSLGATASANYTLVISAPFNPGSLPAARAGVPYSQTITAIAGSGPATNFTISSGALPSGLTLSAGGVLSGTPISVGTFNFTVSANDTFPSSGSFIGSQLYSLTVFPRGTLPFTDTFTRANNLSLGASWTILTGGIAVQSNAGQVTSSAPALATVYGVTRADVTLQVDATLPANGAQVGLVARQSGTGDTNEYVGRLIRSGASYLTQILRFDNGVATQLASTDVAAFPGVGATTTLKFEVIGVSLKLYVGTGPNNLAAFATDSTYIRGAIGVRGSMGTTIDNFMVSDVPVAAPTLPDNFSTSGASNQLDPNWEDRAGNFTVGGGMAKASPLVAGNADLSVLRNANYADVVVSADVNLIAGQRIGLVARYQGSGDNTMYFGEIDNRTGTPVARISYSSATTSVVLNTAASAPGLAGNLRFVVVGNGLQLFLGNTLLTFATDTALTQGTVGVRANAGTNLDNFNAVALPPAAAPFPYADPFSPTADGQLQAVWQIRQGDFQVAGARAVGQDPQTSDLSSNNPKKVNLAILSGLSTITDVNVSAMVTVDPGKHAGLVLRYEDDNNFYLGMLNNANGTPIAQIYFDSAGALTLLSQAAAPSNTGTLQFQAVGGALQLSLGGTPLTSVTNYALRAGSVGIRSSAIPYGTFNVNQAASVLGPPPFMDSFSVNGPLSASWTTVRGIWAVSGGTAAGQSFRNEAVLPGVNSTDVVVAADVNVLNGQIAGLVARYSGAGDANEYLGMLDNSSGSPQVQIFYIDAAGNSKLLTPPTAAHDSVGHPVSAGTLRFEVVGSSLRLFLNNLLQVAVLNTALTQGAVGMRGSTATTFDNFNAMAAPAVLPFTDNFNAGTSLSNTWLNEIGNFTVAGGTANSTSAVNVASLPGVNATDVVLSVDINVASGQQAGLIARHLSIGNSSYYLGRIFFPSGGSPRAQILRINGGVQTTLSDVPATGIVANTFQTLRFEVVGSSQRLFLANTLQTFVTDTTRTNGSVGIRTSNTSVDNFNATAYVPGAAGAGFSDNFNTTVNQQLAATWATRVGDFSVSGGFANALSTGVNLAVLSGVSVADVNLSVDIALAAGQQAGLVARYHGTGDDSMYIAVLDNASGIPVARIIRVSGTGQQTVLASAAAPSGTGTLRFQIVGSSMRLLLDAALLVDVIDFNPLAAGSVGIRGSATTFDNFTDS